MNFSNKESKNVHNYIPCVYTGKVLYSLDPFYIAENTKCYFVHMKVATV